MTKNAYGPKKCLSDPLREQLIASSSINAPLSAMSEESVGWLLTKTEYRLTFRDLAAQNTTC